MYLEDLPTPCLLLDRAVLRRNLKRMADHVQGLGGVLRPHVKTHKSQDVQAELKRAGGTRGITVSTLAEAEYFFAAGERDILYAVGIAPGKLDQIAGLMRGGADIKIILDSAEMARLVASRGVELGVEFAALIELDVDGHRAGADPEGSALLEIAAACDRPGIKLGGVMTHAGGSYDCKTTAEIREMAEQERRLAVRGAERLRAAGHAVPIVSIGSTPTAMFASSLDGVTEVRAGVYTFQDLVQAGLGVCGKEDIAISVLGSVIGHQRAKGWTLTDAGWMAMSRDRGTEHQAIDYGYGEVWGLDGRPLGGLILSGANQEHGIMTRGAHASGETPDLEVGQKVRIAPNHACATAAQFDRYMVIEGGQLINQWERGRGW
ncbi:alanine racemase [Maricaulis sp.]|uniref:alanine racemase n=1 Tax=Maricaulis sp. TaxID=1486257 RepID=UPI00262CCEA0|nr:alanine racemase [Maricaulis sp.]